MKMITERTAIPLAIAGAGLLAIIAITLYLKDTEAAWKVKSTELDGRISTVEKDALTVQKMGDIVVSIDRRLAHIEGKLGIKP